MSGRHERRYAAYKESGVEWLGEVPEHWALQRHKDCFYFISDRCADSTFLKVGLENIEGKTGRFIPTETEFDGDGIQFKKDDILFGKLRPYLAKVYLAEFRGNSVGDIFVYRCKRNTMPKFARYLMLSDLYIDVINSSTAGAKMPRVSSSFITDLPVAMPLFEEQSAIIFYLDTKTAQIDRQVKLLSKKATQYGKLKQSLINETVTRGLNRSVPMKESGVEWIGEVPAHWDVKRLKEAFNERSQKGYPKEPLLIASQTHGVTLKSSYSRNTMTVQNDFHLMKLVNKNDFVISLRSFEGGIEISAQRGIISAAYTILTPATNEDARYYKHLFKSTRFISLLVTCATGIREGRNVNYQQLKRELLPAPPISEQTAMAAYLDTKTAQIDRIISTINTQIVKLKELRKTLINDVVTGKIKVIPEGELA
jgi:type I restriction enzyme, S subunit